LPSICAILSVSGIFDDAGFFQLRYVHRRSILETLKIAQIDGNDLLAVYIGKASLGNTSVQRHLAALETKPGSAGTSLLTLMSLTCGLAVSGRMAAASPKIVMLGTFCRPQIG